MFGSPVFPTGNNHFMAGLWNGTHFARISHIIIIFDELTNRMCSDRVSEETDSNVLRDVRTQVDPVQDEIGSFSHFERWRSRRRYVFPETLPNDRPVAREIRAAQTKIHEPAGREWTRNLVGDRHSSWRHRFVREFSWRERPRRKRSFHTYAYVKYIYIRRGG